MPEFFIAVTYSSGLVEFRTAQDARHARKIIAGFKGRYPEAGIAVHSVNDTTDVTGDFITEA